MPAKTALIFGATGLIGGHLWKLLSENPEYDRIVLFSRRELDINEPKIEVQISDLTDEDRLSDLIQGDAVFICLGTTMAKAGSKEAFRAVDVDMPIMIARLASKNGVRALAMVSSLGADPRSWIFYNRAKGEAEEGIKQFDFERLVILRPGVLMGNRDEKRPGEDSAKLVMSALSPIMIGPWQKYRPIEAKTVARAMMRLVDSSEDQVVYESDHLQEIGRGSAESQGKQQ